MGWKGESRRHSLSRKGIKTAERRMVAKGNDRIKNDNYSYSINNNPYLILKDTGYGYEDTYLKRFEYDDFDKADVDHYMYHTTNMQNLGGIKEKGLLSAFEKLWEDSQIGNYFSEYPAYSMKWYVRNLMLSNKLNNEQKFIVLRIPYAKYNVQEETVGISEYGTSYVVKQDISPQDIEIKTKQGWIALKELDL